MCSRFGRFSLNVENEQADAGLDGRTGLARPNSQARTGTRKYIFFPVQLTTSRILPRPPNTNDDIEQSPSQGGITVEGDLEQLNGDSARSNNYSVR